MTADLSLLLLPLLAGFAFSAALNEATGLISQGRLGFELFFRAERQAWRALPFLMFAGPAILVRMARQRASREGWSGRAPVLAVVLALVWAPASGHLLLRVAGWASSLAPAVPLMLAQG